MCTCAMRSSMPMPIRFGGVPTGVAMPPTEAPNDVISISRQRELPHRVPRRLRRAAPRASGALTIDSPIGNIIAVVAVLLIHIESAVATPP